MDLKALAGETLGRAREDYAAATAPSPAPAPASTPTIVPSGWKGVPYALPAPFAPPGGVQTTPPAPAGPTPEQIAAQEAARVAAEQAAQRSNLQKSIQKLVGDAMGVYDTLYGNLGTAAASQRRQLEQQFGEEESAMQQQFTQELPRIGTAYAGRGAYDSSWRINAEQTAQDQMLSQLRGLGMERQAQMGALGKSVAEQEAQFRTGQDALNRTLADLGTTTDLEKLTAIQNDVQRRISELQAQQAGLQSQEAFVQRFQQIGGPTSRTGQVKATIDRILAGQAAPELKQNVAAGFIQSSGLTPEEQDALIQYLNTSIERFTAPATAAAPATPTA